MENINQNIQSNHFVDAPRESVDENKIEHAALPADASVSVVLQEGDTQNIQVQDASLAPKQEVQQNVLPPSKLQTLRKILKTLQESIGAAVQLLDTYDTVSADSSNTLVVSSTQTQNDLSVSDKETVGKITEGVFDGEHMVGANGQIYNVPPNYASKSKLIEGDLMKLTITPTGAFVYKQIGPIERDRIRGTLLHDKETGEYAVAVDNNVYRVLKASVTYFKGEEGDEVVLIVPKNAPSRFGAVENIIKKKIVV